MMRSKVILELEIERDGSVNEANPGGSLDEPSVAIIVCFSMVDLLITEDYDDLRCLWMFEPN